jgi:NADPH:quinone reductase-like Zn-dependent oxidoreductase
MRAVCAVATDADDPVGGVRVVDVADDPVDPDWVTVEVRTASVNHHDLWTLRGPAPGPLPLVLGTDAAGVTDDGREVIVHAVLADPDRGRGDETRDPSRHLLSEQVPGTFAPRVRVPARNLVPKPPELAWEHAACLPTAWLTAFRMLTTHGAARPGDTVLVQGAGGGVATAAVLLAPAMGLRTWVASRDAEKRAWALEAGADGAFPTGAELPEPVDLVLETVGAATWQHSLDSVRFGGRIVVSGITSGPMPPADLLSVLAKVVTVQGSVMGTAEELQVLSRFLVRTGIRPLLDSVTPMSRAAEPLRRMQDGLLRGKAVLTMDL